jgi:alkylation response protein AidB-like acyl-CoA dehydrogenase
MLGAMHRVFEMGLEYSRNRVQFGRPIGSFQAIKHRLADAALALENATNVVRAATWRMHNGSPDAMQLVAVSKAFCGRAGIQLAESMLHVHGGLGYTWECDVHWYLKALRLWDATFGNANDQLGWITSRLLNEEVNWGTG